MKADEVNELLSTCKVIFNERQKAEKAAQGNIARNTKQPHYKPKNPERNEESNTEQHRATPKATQSSIIIH